MCRSLIKLKYSFKILNDDLYLLAKDSCIICLLFLSCIHVQQLLVLVYSFVYHICLKKRLGVYYHTGPLGPALKQDRRLFEVGICSQTILELFETFHTSLSIL